MSKTHFRKIKDPNFLGSWDLMNEEGQYDNKVFTIKFADKEMVKDHKGQDSSCALLHFEEAKPMFLNSTNLKTLLKVTKSPYIEDWTGKKIEITVKKVKAFGDVHDALRIVNRMIAVEPLNIAPHIVTLEACDSLEALKIAWTAIPAKVKKDPEVMAAKEAAKTRVA